MNIDNKDLEQIVAMVTKELSNYSFISSPKAETSQIGVFSDVNSAVEAATQAQKMLFEMSMEDRKRITDSIRVEMRPYIEEMSKMTVEECGMGRVSDKILKNSIVLDKTPSVEDLKASVFTGDNGISLVELSPYGVIAAVAPCTNPSETIMCNAIGMIAAGNSVVFAPHPATWQTSNRCVHLLNEAIVLAGGPRNLVSILNKPSIEQTNELFTHKKIKLICATGGPGVVKAALSSGKKAIGAGAGNPPVLVDETADLDKAAKDIVAGSSFDNNLPCIAEKEVIAVDAICDYLIFAMKKNGAYQIESKEVIERLTNLVFDKDGNLNRKFVGKDASYILAQIDINVTDDIRLIIMETDKDHLFVQEELMMPILPIVRVKNVTEGIDLACQVEHGYRHTAICHSKNIDVLTEMGQRIQTTIFVKNGPSYTGIGVGGEGYCTFTIAGPTGEGLTSAATFARKRRCVLVNGLNIR